MKSVVGILFTLILEISLLVGCVPKQVKAPSDEVTLQLKWVHQAQFAGFYVAQEKGYYAEENIKVTFRQGEAGSNNIEPLVSGQTNFLVEAPDAVLAYSSLHKPIAIATIYRRSPLVFIALADSGIHKPSDFIGQAMAVTSGSLDAEVHLKAMMKKLGLDVNEIKMMPYAYDYSSFLSREVKITCGYSTGGVIRLRQKGYQVNLICPSDYGIDMYSDTIFAAERLIAENPELVTRFLRASLKGWQEAVGNPKMAVEMTLKYAKEPELELQSKMMEAQLPLVHTGEDQIGWMKATRWESMYQVLLEQGIITAPFDVNQVYTMRFLEEIYGVKAK